MFCNTNLTVYVASRHPTFSPAATTTVAYSSTRRANPFVITVGFHHIFSISIKYQQKGTSIKLHTMTVVDTTQG